MILWSFEFGLVGYFKKIKLEAINRLFYDYK